MRSEPSRRPLSQRNINISVYLCDDGSLYVHSSMIDLHHYIIMELEIQPDDGLITGATASMGKHPEDVCPKTEQTIQTLVGLKIGPGIMKRILHNIGGDTGCVHMRELATETITFAANQLYNPKLSIDPRARAEEVNRFLKNTCLAYNDENMASSKWHKRLLDIRSGRKKFDV